MSRVSKYLTPLLRLNTFRSENVLNKSHNKLHGLTLCAIIVFNMIFLMTTSSLYPTHTIMCGVTQIKSNCICHMR